MTGRRHPVTDRVHFVEGGETLHQVKLEEARTAEPTEVTCLLCSALYVGLHPEFLAGEGPQPWSA